MANLPPRPLPAGDDVTALVNRVAPTPTRGFRTAGDAIEQWIGRYRLVRLVGEGGMGTVYLAEQREPVQREVALKLMHASLKSPSAEARFGAERQALARLSHSNIAAMYEAGTTDEGFPYFVMELVDGRRITDYCDEHRLSIPQRLQLFVDICNGVQHAHQKGVIHRDLKPSNVLVAETHGGAEEGQAVPKIIDFGISKAVDQPFGTAGLTGEAIIGTPAYMSPEALMGDDLDTRTDIYSLGVLLHELVAGVRPHNVEGHALAAVIREVTQHDAPAPRVLFRTLADDEQQTVAATRGEDVRSLSRALSGDLGWIARKASARDRDERYASAGDFAADIGRYLRDEPVIASPPSFGYVARKFARRHRAGVVAAVLVTLAIIAGTATTTIAMIRAQRARAEAEAVSGFLLDLFDAANPWARSKETTVRELLQEAAARVPHELKDQPAARAELMMGIGTSEFHLGHLPEAERLLRETLRIRLVTDGPDSRVVAQVKNVLGLVCKHRGNLDEAERLLRSSLAIREKAFGHESHSVGRALYDLSSVLEARGKMDEAEKDLREALALRQRLYAQHSPEVDVPTVAQTMQSLGRHLAMRGKPEGESLIRQSLAMRGSLHDYPWAMGTISLGDVVARQGRHAEAEALYRAGLAALEKFVEADDGRLTTARSALAATLAADGKRDEAAELYRHVLASVANDHDEDADAVRQAANEALANLH